MERLWDVPCMQKSATAQKTTSEDPTWWPDIRLRNTSKHFSVHSRIFVKGTSKLPCSEALGAFFLGFALEAWSFFQAPRLDTAAGIWMNFTCFAMTCKGPHECHSTVVIFRHTCFQVAAAAGAARRGLHWKKNVCSHFGVKCFLFAWIACWKAWICLQCTLEQDVSILAQVSLIDRSDKKEFLSLSTSIPSSHVWLQTNQLREGDWKGVWKGWLYGGSFGISIFGSCGCNQCGAGSHYLGGLPAWDGPWGCGRAQGHWHGEEVGWGMGDHRCYPHHRDGHGRRHPAGPGGQRPGAVWRMPAKRLRTSWTLWHSTSRNCPWEKGRSTFRVTCWHFYIFYGGILCATGKFRKSLWSIRKFRIVSFRSNSAAPLEVLHRRVGRPRKKLATRKFNEWFGKQLEKTKGNFSNAPDQSENILQAALCGKIWNEAIHVTRESPYTRRSPWTSVLIDTNAVSKKEKIKQTIRRKRRAEWSGFGGAPTGCKEFGSLPRRFLVSTQFQTIPMAPNERTTTSDCGP